MYVWGKSSIANNTLTYYKLKIATPSPVSFLPELLYYLKMFCFAVDTRTTRLRCTSQAVLVNKTLSTS